MEMVTLENVAALDAFADHTLTTVESLCSTLGVQSYRPSYANVVPDDDDLAWSLVDRNALVTALRRAAEAVEAL